MDYFAYFYQEVSSWYLNEYFMNASELVLKLFGISRIMHGFMLVQQDFLVFFMQILGFRTINNHKSTA